MNGLNLNNPPKFYLILILIIGATLLCAVGKIDAITYVAIVGPIGGYAVGNGIAAKNDQPVEPMIGRKPDTDDDDVDRAGPVPFRK